MRAFVRQARTDTKPPTGPNYPDGLFLAQVVPGGPGVLGVYLFVVTTVEARAGPVSRSIAVGRPMTRAGVSS